MYRWMRVCLLLVQHQTYDMNLCARAGCAGQCVHPIGGRIRRQKAGICVFIVVDGHGRVENLPMALRVPGAWNDI